MAKWQGEPCPECGDTQGLCEHICQQCDDICIFTCSDGLCEHCCAETCERSENGSVCA